MSTQVFEDTPVIFARFDNAAVGVVSEFVNDIKRFPRTPRRIENTRVGNNPAKPAQDNIT